MKIKFLDGTEREIAVLAEADLHEADLHGANLHGVNLRGANLSLANLSGVNLYRANLSGVNLYRANLSGAYLGGVNLYRANLSGAYLHGANLHGAYLTGAKHLARFCILAEGDITGYKKLANDTIATLFIPRQAKRVNAYSSRKCRAEFAYVLNGEGVDQHTGKTQYAKGTMIIPDSYDPDPRVECSNGIHFFITKEEAQEYV